MKDFEQFVAEASEADVRLNVELARPRPQSADALFHLPLLALAMLVVSSTKKRNFYTYELSSWTGALLVQHFAGLRKAARKLEWSVTLRARCADALVFLESIGFAVVTGDDRRVSTTSIGRNFLRKCVKDTEEIGTLTRTLIRANARVQLTGMRLL